MKPAQPIRINKSFGFASVKEVTNVAVPHIKIKGYASKMLDVEGKFVIDADRENIDTMGIGLKRLKSGNLPLLYGHDQSKPVGKITAAAYKQDGLEIEATLYKLPGDELTNFVYESVKVGTLNSFSVGIIVEEFDMVEKDGEDYLQLSKSEMIETSIVAVPSNNEATFGILEVKSVDTDKPSEYKTIISKNILKQDNPNVCGEFETCMLESVKALNYEDTKNEPWMTNRQFHVYLESLVDTLVDNFDANRWDELSALEVTKNIKEAFLLFMADQEDLLKGNEKPNETIDELNASLAHAGSFAFSDNAKSINGDIMQTKDAEETPATVVDQAKEEVVTPKVKEEPKEEAPVEESTKEEVKEEPKEEPKEIIVEVPKEQTIDDLIANNAIMGANLTDMDLEDMEKIYNSIGALSQNIADFVTAQVQEEREAQVADKPEA